MGEPTEGYFERKDSLMTTSVITPQVAAIPFRIRGQGPSIAQRVEVLLVTSSVGLWSVPKGHIDDGRSHAEMAMIESYEEAGVIGLVIEPSLGTFEYVKRAGKRCRVDVYALEVHELLEEWQEMDRRERRWVPLDVAEHEVEFDPVAPLMADFERWLAVGHLT